jgi:hypothetical protein
MRRGALQEVGPIEPDFRFAMDWDLWIRLGRRFPSLMVDHLIAASREYSSTKTASGGFGRTDEIRRVVHRHTGREISVGYLNYLLYTVLDELRESEMPEQAKMEEAIHQVLTVCRRLLQGNRVRQPRSPAGRFVRSVMPEKLRRAGRRLLHKVDRALS